MYESFKVKAELANAEVHRVATRREALDLIVERLEAEGVAGGPGLYAVWADCPFLDDLDRQELAATIPGLRFDVTRELAAASHLGISQMDWAIADTGSVAQDATAVDKRLVSTLVDIHIVLVPSDRIVPDLATFLTRLGPEAANYIAVVTGPSRTADIERVLTIGVHGPEQLIIVFVDELGGTL